MTDQAQEAAQPPEVKPPQFVITSGKGFHITFANGWTVSVQFGPYNYCAARHEPSAALAHTASSILGVETEADPHSATAEIAAWDASGVWHEFEDDTVAGYQSPADVLAFMVAIAGRP